MTTLRRAILLIAALVVLMSACSTAATPTPDATESSAAASPTQAASATLAAATAEVSASAGASGDPSIDPWTAHAVGHRGHTGLQFDYNCPPGGVADTIWGTDTYTDDSSVCTAGVHVGVINLEEGGTVTIEIRPGEDEYESSERNGIESSPYPAWGGSFVVVGD